MSTKSISKKIQKFFWYLMFLLLCMYSYSLNSVHWFLSKKYSMLFAICDISILEAMLFLRNCCILELFQNLYGPRGYIFESEKQDSKFILIWFQDNFTKAWTAFLRGYKLLYITYTKHTQTFHAFTKSPQQFFLKNCCWANLNVFYC